MKDWTGTKQFIFSCNYRKADAHPEDYYATDPKAVEILLENEYFSRHIWEPACGAGHITKVLLDHGYYVKSSDIVDRGCPDSEIINFLTVTKEQLKHDFSRDIITNPPYKFAKEFVEKALDISMYSTKIAMFLKLTFLEGRARRELFEKNPPKKVYVFSGRIECGKNGNFTGGSAAAYAWFIWEKGFKGDPVIKWVN